LLWLVIVKAQKVSKRLSRNHYIFVDCRLSRLSFVCECALPEKRRKEDRCPVELLWRTVVAIINAKFRIRMHVPHPNPNDEKQEGKATRRRERGYRIIIIMHDDHPAARLSSLGVAAKMSPK